MKPPAVPAPPGGGAAPGSTSDSSSGVDDRATGLPGLRSWPAVYLFVLGTFVLWIVLLAALSRMFA